MSEQSKVPDVIVASMMTGKWYDRPDGPTSLPEYLSRDHCNDLVEAARAEALTDAMALFDKDEPPLPGCVVLHRLEKLRGKSE